MSIACPSGIRPDVREVVLALGGVGVVEQRLHRVGLDVPGADRVVVDRRTRGQCDPGPAVEKGGERLDEVADDVGAAQPSTGEGLSHLSGATPPTVNGELAGDSPVLVGRTAHRSPAISAVQPGVPLVDAGLHAAGQPLVASFEAVDERLRVEAGAAVAELLEPQRLERDVVGLAVEGEGLDDAVLTDVVEATVEAELHRRRDPAT